MMGFGFGFGGMWLDWLLMLLFWAGVIALAVWAVRSLFPGGKRGERDSALELLQRRYAAGEISAAEYEQAHKAIGQPPAVR